MPERLGGEAEQVRIESGLRALTVDEDLKPVSRPGFETAHIECGGVGRGFLQFLLGQHLDQGGGVAHAVCPAYECGRAGRLGLYPDPGIAQSGMAHHGLTCHLRHGRGRQHGGNGEDDEWRIPHYEKGLAPKFGTNPH